MGKSSGGTRGTKGTRASSEILPDGSSSYKGKIRNVESISKIKDPVVNREVKRAISKYESRVGLRTREVKIADLGPNVMGIAGNGTVHLNKAYFNSKEKLYKAEKGMGISGGGVKTNKPLHNTVVHELSHITWTNRMSGKNHISAGKEIKKVFREYIKDKSTSFGSYAKTNINEFYAEGMTHGVLSKKNKYSKALLDITKKYKL